MKKILVHFLDNADSHTHAHENSIRKQNSFFFFSSISPQLYGKKVCVRYRKLTGPHGIMDNGFKKSFSFLNQHVESHADWHKFNGNNITRIFTRNLAGMGRGIVVFCISELFAIKLSLNFALRRPSFLHPPRATDLEENIPEKKPPSSFPSYRSDRAMSRGGLKSLNCLGKKMCVSVRMCAFLQGDGGKYKNRKSTQIKAIFLKKTLQKKQKCRWILFSKTAIDCDKIKHRCAAFLDIFAGGENRTCNSDKGRGGGYIYLCLRKQCAFSPYFTTVRRFFCESRRGTL